MSIHVYTGTPGSGKSLHAASDIRFQLTRKYPHPIIANFPIGQHAPVDDDLLWKYYNFIPNEDMSAGKIIDFANAWWDSHPDDFREDYITLVLDECQLLFNSRLWSQSSRKSSG